MHSNCIIIMGVSGSGKTTVGSILAGEYHYLFIDGDDLHPPANIEKMRAGIPLTDADRLGWLQAIHATVLELNAQGSSVIVACSALKKTYRDVLRKGIEQLVFIYLKGSFQQIHQLLQSRKEHFMPLALLQSQFAALEEPTTEESDCITVALSDLPEELDEIRKRLQPHLV